MAYLRISTIITLLVSISIAQNNRNGDELLQVSTIDALLGGIYEGEVSIGQLLQSGNFGLGTFNSLDGEMVVMDGICYQIKSDGKVSSVPLSLKTPFAAVTFFKTDKKAFYHDTLTFDQLLQKIDSLTSSFNLIYAVKVKGRIITAKARSVPSQKPPYRQLAQITKNQPVFSFDNVNGTLIGFRCPSYVKSLNVPGYHFHLITDDKKSGGHLLSLVADSLTIEIDETDSYRLLMPHDKFFMSADFNGNKEDVLKKVEQ